MPRIRFLTRAIGYSEVDTDKWVCLGRGRGTEVMS